MNNIQRPFGRIWEYKEPQEAGAGGSEATLYWKSDASLASQAICARF